MKFQKAFGSIELLLAAIIWGFAFVAQATGSESLPPFTITCIRSIIAALFLSGMIFIMKVLRKKAGIVATDGSKRDMIIGGICCGVVLFIASNLQQFGIGLYPEGAGASGRTGFITALYVVLVPCFSVFFKHRIHPLVWVGVVIALSGMYLLCFKSGVSSIYKGDIVVFFCAIAFCCHILVVDYFVARANGVVLSCIQFLTVGVLSFVMMLLTEHPDPKAILDAALPILYLGIMSSGVAYTFQIIGQHNTEPTVASILMSLESVFAVIGGWLILGERLSPRELCGCGLMFVAIIVAQSPGFIKHSKIVD